MLDLLLHDLRIPPLFTADIRGVGGAASPSIGIREGRVDWLGPTLGAPEAARRESLAGRWVTPALIDAHTHLVFAGDRSEEFERRLAGESYEEIARRGGGIRSTVAATRAATLDELVEGAARRIAVLASEGVGTVEIKSGYGLDRESELRMLEAARAAGARAGVRVSTSLLAAHAVPPEYDGRPDDYLDEVCIPLVREAAESGLADAVDAFCETIAFTPAQTRRLFDAASEAGLPVRLHADQLSDLGGAALAAEYGALSADHLEYTGAEGARAMARAGTVATLLPGAWYTLRERRRPPVEAFRAAGTRMAVATDANPGSSPLLSLLTAANMACIHLGLTVPEALEGITLHAAAALGMAGRIGTIAVGAEADLAVWEVERPAEIIQWIGRRPLTRRMRAGVWR